MRTTARQTRENRTITVDFQNEATYFHLLGDGKAFLECVLAFLLALGFQLTHKATCGGGGGAAGHTPYSGAPPGWVADQRLVRTTLQALFPLLPALGFAVFHLF